MKSHEELDVWRLGIDLVDHVYDLTQVFPADERFGLSSQLRRAAVSIPANIAEGAGRDSTKDFLRHLSISQGSLAEVTTLLIIVKRRGYSEAPPLRETQDLAQQVGRLLRGLQKALRRKLPS